MDGSRRQFGRRCLDLVGRAGIDVSEIVIVLDHRLLPITASCRSF